MTGEQRALLTGYLRELDLRDVKFRKITSMKSCVIRLFDYLAEYDLPIREVKVRDAVYYQKYLIETGRKDGNPYAGRTVKSMMSIAVNFYDYLKAEKQVLSNPFREVRKIREEKKLPDNVLTEKQMFCLLADLAGFEGEQTLLKKIRAYRVHVTAELMYSSGLRISETAALKEEDIDLMRGVVRVVNGKGGKNRTVFLNEYACEVLKIYLEDVKPLLETGKRKKKDERIFNGKEEWLGKQVNEVLKERCEKLKVPVITSHGFRHSMGYHLLRAGLDIRYIQNLLGHEKLGTTEVYTRVDKTDLRNVILKYHPRNFNFKESALLPDKKKVVLS